MAVYEHRQKDRYGTYKSYRVARSVDGITRQKYFPFTAAGKKKAEALDEQWEQEQAEAQRHFTGIRARWRRTA